ncbi:MAG: polyphosphate polymerase domain-containing protein [Oscillospiraceae bacterium]|nr:polyphosphate polymerase domain-containing protein [Oscillospiraceae bacterium]
MSGIQSCFKRCEKKYMLTQEQYRAMMLGMAFRMRPDEHPRYTIGNVYYDTDNYALIRASLEKPVYKEKLRVRSYGVPGDDGLAFVEIKKKFDGVVYKRRVTMTTAQAATWLQGGRPNKESQISREIDWFMRLYNPRPAVYIAYDREAYAGIDNSELRITFDRNLRWRDTNVDLRNGDGCKPIDVGGKILMEIKIPGAAPLWLARLLSENGIVPTSFSKYGAYYKQAVLKTETNHTTKHNHYNKEARSIA